ncbi:plasmid partitioning protein RepB C-terminal domain-containing protein [soil metagenome]
MNAVAAFEKQCRVLPIAAIVRFRPVTAGRHNTKYRQILASIREVGLVESPVVFPIGGTDTFGLMDGHLRIQALQELKQTEVACLIATDDDSYTYNQQITRLTPVQDNKMIAAAIKQGVSAERLAAALNISLPVLKSRKTLLDGICPEARAMLANKDCARSIFDVLKRLKPLRQIEACELMEGQNSYAPSFVRAILAATTADQMVKPKRIPVDAGALEQMLRFEKELGKLQDQVKSIENSYGPDVLKFTTIMRYVADLISKPSIAGIMRNRHPDLLREFERMGEITILPDAAPVR